MDKQALLKRHRKRARYKLLALLIALFFVGILDWRALLPLALLIWLAQEAWFCDHQFYPGKTDYRYRFPEGTPCWSLEIKDGCLHLPQAQLDGSETLILQVNLKARWLGRWFDPHLTCADNRQDFERGACGIRYFNLSGQGHRLMAGGLPLIARFCRIIGEVKLYAFKHPDYWQKAC